MKYKPWTDEEVAYIKENYRDFTIAELAEQLGRTFSSVKAKIYVLDLPKNNRWTRKQEERILAMHLAGRSTEYIADVMGISFYSTARRLWSIKKRHSERKAA